MEGQLKRHKLQLKSRISQTPSQYVRSAIGVSIKTQGSWRTITGETPISDPSSIGSVCFSTSNKRRRKKHQEQISEP
ncbi:hypothetical protein KY290_027356 [Solanum tuberosum]|uniref:Uncharacterized protein n=1 Tax=Solanum tuberosum TaxID=4113 RepID=A0ABQ7UEX3_SOLTU|nr:hypothetical protein KY290_027356 [Solanum tuberosum]